MRNESAERLQKALAHLGLASRREAEAWIRAGRVTVNGEVASLGTRVSGSDQIRLDGRLIRRRRMGEEQAFVCHRSPGEKLQSPQGLPQEAAPDAPGRAPLLERLPHVSGRRFIAVSPMPGIDGGLELVTADGELAAKLQRSVRHLISEFSIRIRGELSAAQLERLHEGELDRGGAIEVQACKPSGGEGANRWYALTARGASGKDVRQLFERQGVLVSRVLRTRLGPLALERSLGRGRFRPLSPPELASLFQEGGLVHSPASSERRTNARTLPRRRAVRRSQR